MKFNEQYFDQLTDELAEQFYHRFMHDQCAAATRLAGELNASGIRADFTLESITAIFAAVSPRLGTVDVPPQPWMANDPEYLRQSFRFDQASDDLILPCAFYFGESFCRTYGPLRWAIGDSRYMQQHQPVVAGFAGQLELPVIIVVHNVLHQMHTSDHSTEPLLTCVEQWSSSAAPVVQGSHRSAIQRGGMSP